MLLLIGIAAYLEKENINILDAKDEVLLDGKTTDYIERIFEQEGMKKGMVARNGS